MNADESHMQVLRSLLTSQLLGVLGTHHDRGPYTSLVGFAATQDLKHLLFATGRSTRKIANLQGDARASMLVDNRTNQSSDFTDSAAATAVGVVEEIGEAERDKLEDLFLAKHPQLESFLGSPSCAFLRLRVSVYMVVTRFQQVMELHIDP